MAKLIPNWLLQKEQAVQRLVVSLVSDNAVWDAVLKNKVVRQLQKSLFPGKMKEGTLPRMVVGSGSVGEIQPADTITSACNCNHLPVPANYAGEVYGRAESEIETMEKLIPSKEVVEAPSDDSILGGKMKEGTLPRMVVGSCSVGEIQPADTITSSCNCNHLPVPANYAPTGEACTTTKSEIKTMEKLIPSKEVVEAASDDSLLGGNCNHLPVPTNYATPVEACTTAKSEIETMEKLIPSKEVEEAASDDSILGGKMKEGTLPRMVVGSGSVGEIQPTDTITSSCNCNHLPVPANYAPPGEACTRAKSEIEKLIPSKEVVEAAFDDSILGGKMKEGTLPKMVVGSGSFGEIQPAETITSSCNCNHLPVPANYAPPSEACTRAKSEIETMEKLIPSKEVEEAASDDSILGGSVGEIQPADTIISSCNCNHLPVPANYAPPGEACTRAKSEIETMEKLIPSKEIVEAASDDSILGGKMKEGTLPRMVVGLGSVGEIQPADTITSSCNCNHLPVPANYAPPGEACTRAESEIETMEMLIPSREVAEAPSDDSILGGKMKEGTLPRMVVGSGSVGEIQPADTITSSCNCNHLPVPANNAQPGEACTRAESEIETLEKLIASKEVVEAPSDDSILGVPANYAAPGEACTRAENERGDKSASGHFYNLIFRLVPSRFEVENGVSAFQNFMQGISSPGSTSSWFIQMFRNHGPKLLQSSGFGRVFQGLVVSLVSDKAVRDAVLKNKVVRQLQKSLFPALEGGRPRSYDNEQDWVMDIIRWILDIAKAKVMELIESFRAGK